MSDSDDDLFADDEDTTTSAAALFGVLHLLDDETKSSDALSTESLRALLASSPDLLDLSNRHLGEHGNGQLLAAALADAPPGTLITQLRLNDNEIGDDSALQTLAIALTAAPLHGLEHLDLSANQLGSLSIGNVISKLRPSLTHLDVSDNPLGDDGFAALSRTAIDVLPAIGKLYLNRISVGDQGCTAFAAAVTERRQGGNAAAVWPQLSEFWLSNNQIGDDGAKAILAAVGMGAMPALGDLRLQFNALGDASVHALAATLATGALSRAWYIGLSDNLFGDDALSALGDAIVNGSTPRLEFITVAGSRTSAAGEKLLQDALTRRPR